MKAVFKNEIKSLLSSFSLMLAVAVFFVLVGLWLWFFPQTSILDNKFSTLQTLFDLAPWLFLFIVPALTMRTLAEEKSTGTLDILRSKPISMWYLVVGKFLAILMLLCIMVLISQVYTFSVYQLGFPKGNLDIGGTAGSFLAWLLLAASFTAIGIYASVISRSQMIAFLLSVFLCFLIYNGPAFLATLPIFVGNFDYFIQSIGLQAHYQSLSRGVITSSNIFYFIGVILFFLHLSAHLLNFESSINMWKSFVKNKWFAIASIGFIGSAFSFFTIDLTEDKRFTLTKETKSLVNTIDDVIYAEVLMDENLPAAFTRLRKSALDLLHTFNTQNKNLQYNLVDPLEGSAEDIKANQENLRKDGITPTQLTVYNGKEQEQKIIYPYVIFHFGERMIPVNLLEAQDPNQSEDEILNRSVSLLEYKFGNAIQKLRMKRNPVVVFTRGHGELNTLQTADLERSLRPIYSTGRITLDSVVQIDKEINILIVAKPQTAFSTRDIFLIDQYIMNGGKVIWYIDPLFVNTDTVNATNRLKQDFIPLPYELNLDELFFKYGFRIQPNVVMDYECTTLPLYVGSNGGTPKFEPKPWYYHPLIAASSRQSIVRNIDRIFTFYPATIDTIRTTTNITKTILLSSSSHSRTITSPSPINFEIVRQEPSPDLFNKPAQPIALLLEGWFPSAFKNRVPENFSDALKQIKAEFKEESVPTKMIVFSDGDLPANAISSRGEPAPLGYNMYEQSTYPANKNLVLNSIEYLLDENNMMNARNKEIKLRLLDEATLKKNKPIWQWFNLLLPVLISLIIYMVSDFIRKRAYAKI